MASIDSFERLRALIDEYFQQNNNTLPPGVSYQSNSSTLIEITSFDGLNVSGLSASSDVALLWPSFPFRLLHIPTLLGLPSQGSAGSVPGSLAVYTSGLQGCSTWTPTLE